MKKIILSLASLMLMNSLAADSSQEPKVGEFCWNELATTDLQAAKDFYGKVFDWKFNEQQVDGKTYVMINKNDKDFAGIWQIPSDKSKEIPPHWMSYVCVDNLNATIEKCRQNKATIIKGPIVIKDKGSFAIIQDPSGAHFALWEPAAKK